MRLLLPLFLFSLYAAASWNYRGNLDFESRFYQNDDNPDTNDTQLSSKALLQSEYEKGRYQAKFGFFAREAFLDHERDFFALTETNLGFYAGNWVFSAGFHIYNWKVLEIFSPVDTLNALNYDNTGEAERIGLPSVSITCEFDQSLAQFIYIPAVAPSHFTQERNRQGLQVELEDPEMVTGNFETSGSPNLFQFIFRWQKNFDNIEARAYYAQMYDTFRPLILIDIPQTFTTDLNALEITPYYFPSAKTALALQGSAGEWILKFEGSHVDYQDYKMATFLPPAQSLQLEQLDHTATAAGAEKTFYFDNNHSGTLYLEYIHIFAREEDRLATLGAFTRDAALGYRHSFNDFKRNEFNMALLQDTLDGDERLLALGHEFRPAPAWKLSLDIVFIDAPKPDPSDPLDLIYGLKPVRESDNILLTLSRYF